MLKGVGVFIISFCFCKVNELLSLLHPSAFAMAGVVHTLSFVDTAQVIKNIGIFREVRKPVTTFQRK